MIQTLSQIESPELFSPIFLQIFQTYCTQKVKCEPFKGGEMRRQDNDQILNNLSKDASVARFILFSACALPVGEGLCFLRHCMLEIG